MSQPSIAVINFTSTLEDNAVIAAINAVNRQINENFLPIWGCARALEFFTPAFDPADEKTLAEEDVPADSVMYLVDEASVPGALGFHDLNTKDLPFGFVFVLDPNDWTTTLSHECLELILDPAASAMVPGPDPNNSRNTVLHAYEACDAVERLSYQIDGITVSDFVTPSYFTPGEAKGRRNDFLGVNVKSFGVTKGSHIGYFDLRTGKFEEFIGKEVAVAAGRARRLSALDHKKPNRPTDDHLDAVLAQYRNSPLARKASGLPDLRGITRTARYRGAAMRMMERAAA